MIDNRKQNSSFTKHRNKSRKGSHPHWGWEVYPFWLVVVMLMLAFGRALFK